MAGCGCQSSGCNVIGDGATTDVVDVGGGKCKVSARLPILGVADTDCVDLEIDANRILRALLNLFDTDSINLECAPGGLRADLRLDPASPAPLSVTAAGLSVGCCATGGGDIPLGIPVDFEGWIVPANWMEAYGQEVQVNTYPELYDALTLVTNTATTVSGSGVVTGIPSTQGMAAGMWANALGFGGHAQIASVDGPNQVTLSGVSGGSFPGTAVFRVFKDGIAASEAFFIVPDHRDITTAGLGNMGGNDRNIDDMTAVTGGASIIHGSVFGFSDVTLGVGQIAPHTHAATVDDPGHDHVVNDAGHSHGVVDPGHDHGVTDPGHVHDVTTDAHDHDTGTGFSGRTDVGDDDNGLHVHEAGPAGSDRSFVMVDTSTLTNVTVDGGSPGDDYSIVVSNNDANAGVLQQLNNVFTDQAGSHGHRLQLNDDAPGGDALLATTGVDVSPAGTGITIAADGGGIDVSPAASGITVDVEENVGAGGAHDNIQPTRFVRRIMRYR